MRALAGYVNGCLNAAIANVTQGGIAEDEIREIFRGKFGFNNAFNMPNPNPRYSRRIPNTRHYRAQSRRFNGNPNSGLAHISGATSEPHYGAGSLPAKAGAVERITDGIDVRYSPRNIPSVERFGIDPAFTNFIRDSLIDECTEIFSIRKTDLIAQTLIQDVPYRTNFLTSHRTADGYTPLNQMEINTSCKDHWHQRTNFIWFPTSEEWRLRADFCDDAYHPNERPDLPHNRLIPIFQVVLGVLQPYMPIRHIRSETEDITRVDAFISLPINPVVDQFLWRERLIYSSIMVSESLAGPFL